MGFEALVIFALVTLASAFIVGGVFIHTGGKPDETGKTKPVFVLVGWLIIAAALTLAIAGLVIISIMSSSFLVLLIVGSPLIIITGIILTLAFGIANLIKGYKKDADGHFNKKYIISGWACLGINLIIIALIVCIIILFTTGVIRIALM